MEFDRFDFRKKGKCSATPGGQPLEGKRNFTREEKAIRKERRDRFLEMSWGYGNHYSEKFIRATTAGIIREGGEILTSNQGDRSAASFTVWKEEFRKHCFLIDEDELFFGAVLSAILAGEHPERRGALRIYKPGENPKRDANGTPLVQLAAMRGLSLEDAEAVHAKASARTSR